MPARLYFKAQSPPLPTPRFSRSVRLETAELDASRLPGTIRERYEPTAMALRVELINTGSELLLGSVINTHLPFLAECLFPLGLRISRQVTVPDGEAIEDALRETHGRAEIVVVTGGLGPTTDDITREAAARWLGLDLVMDPAVLSAIQERFACRGLAMSPRVALQAYRPQQAQVLANAHGTAPGLYLPAMRVAADGPQTPHLFLLPGPPRELRPMFSASVEPLLRKLIAEHSPEPPKQKRVYRIVGCGESEVEAALGEDLLSLGIELGYCARPGEVDLRILGDTQQLHQAEQKVQEKFGRHIVSSDERTLEKVVVDLLHARGQTLATAESCTGGMIAHRVTNVAGASHVFHCGYVCYANAAKIRDLGVLPETIETRGAVSAEVAAQLAAGVLEKTGSDHALATTGIAGPGGGTGEKPVGTVYIALSSRSAPTVVNRHSFPTDRENFKRRVTQTALEMLRKRLMGLE